jgi:UDP-N-acetyl-D-mannosaminuronic acid dehydrogenase
VCVVGLGYIGLPTASLLAARGYSVTGVDVSKDVVATSNRRDPIVEPDLDGLVHSRGARGSMTATLVRRADVYVIAVPTPLTAGEARLSMVEAAARHRRSWRGTLPLGVLGESGRDDPGDRRAYPREPVMRCGGCARRVLRRVLPGRILTELVERSRRPAESIGRRPTRPSSSPDVRARRVIGTDGAHGGNGETDREQHRDVNIAFANELSMICARGDLVWELIRREPPPARQVDPARASAATASRSIRGSSSPAIPNTRS